MTESQPPERPYTTPPDPDDERLRRRRGSTPGLFVGLLLIWLGISFFLSNAGYLQDA